MGLQWEIVVIDNASSDDTVAVVQGFARDNPGLNVRVLSEMRRGASVARQRGIYESRCDLILFVDDDNWLKPNYVGTIAETMSDNPTIAGLGGMSDAVCESPAPEWFDRYRGWYAITGPAHSTQPQLTNVHFLWTAGAAFRRTELIEIIESAPLFTNSDSEDIELCCRLRSRGGVLYRHRDISFTHYLTAPRLNWQHLRQLHYVDGYHSATLDFYRYRQDAPVTLMRAVQTRWIAQVLFVCFQIVKRTMQLWVTGVLAAAGNEHVTALDVYRGRLAGLWARRNVYMQATSNSAAALAPTRRVEVEQK